MPWMQQKSQTSWDFTAYAVEHGTYRQPAPPLGTAFMRVWTGCLISWKTDLNLLSTTILLHPIYSTLKVLPNGVTLSKKKEMQVFLVSPQMLLSQTYRPDVRVIYSSKAVGFFVLLYVNVSIFGNGAASCTHTNGNFSFWLLDSHRCIQ